MENNKLKRCVATVGAVLMAAIVIWFSFQALGLFGSDKTSSLLESQYGQTAGSQDAQASEGLEGQSSGGQDSDDQAASAADSDDDVFSVSSDQSLPDGWETWDEEAAPNYVVEVGAAKIRQELEAGEISYSDLDELRRPGLVAARLTHEIREAAKERGRQEIEINPTGWPKHNPKSSIVTQTGETYTGRFWNRSHLLADSLGGDPTHENLVPGSRMQNTGGDDDGGMAYGERIAREWLDEHEDGTLYYSALPLYVDDELIPRAVVVDMKSSDGGIDMELLVYNAAKGYTINYNTGTVKRS